MTYGDPLPTFTGSVTGRQGTDVITESFSVDGAVSSSGNYVAGTHNIIPTAVGSPSVLANYVITPVNGALAIGQKAVTLSMNGANKVYDSTTADPGATFSVTNPAGTLFNFNDIYYLTSGTAYSTVYPGATGNASANSWYQQTQDAAHGGIIITKLSNSSFLSGEFIQNTSLHNDIYLADGRWMTGNAGNNGAQAAYMSTGYSQGLQNPGIMYYTNNTTGFLGTNGIRTNFTMSSFDLKGSGSVTFVGYDANGVAIPGDTFTTNLTSTFQTYTLNWANVNSVQCTAGSFSMDNLVINAPPPTVITGDLVTPTGTAAFTDPHVGTGKVVNPVTYGLTGADAGNYIVSAVPAPSTANITQVTLYVTTTPPSITYGDDIVPGTPPNASYSTTGLGVNDTLTLTGWQWYGTYSTSGHFANPGPGGQYIIPQFTSSDPNFSTDYLLYNGGAIMHVNPLAVNVSNITANNKVYDATTTATISGTIATLLPGDVVGLSATANFADKNVGTGKTVNVSNIALSGHDAADYVYNGPATVTSTANITPAPFTVTATANDKVYDTTTTATVAVNGPILGPTRSPSVTALPISPTRTWAPTRL